MKTIFITGATGNIGAKIVEILLDNQTVKELILFIRAKDNATAQYRIKNTLLQIAPNINLELIAKKIKVVCGDLCQQNLGLSHEDCRYILSKTTHIIHSAAATKFDISIESARKINVEGTRNLIMLAQKIHETKRLKGIAHISTAYVNGHSYLPIYETDLNENQEFANNYEQSKWETEKLIRDKFSHLPFCIFRPSIVVGDSQTGRTVNYNVLYPVLRFISSGLINTLPGRANTKLDIVPVDYVANSVIKILLDAKAVTQKTYHLVAGDKYSISIRDIIHISCLKKNSEQKGVRFIPLFLFSLMKPFLSVKTIKLCKILETYRPYMRQTYQFDSNNTVSMLKKSMGESINNRGFISRNINFYAHSNWGRKNISA